MNRNKVLFPVLFLALGFSACSNESKPIQQAPVVVRNISLVEVQKRNVPDVLEAVGTVHAAQTTTLASQMMGNIVDLRAREGDHVQRGQILAIIDDSQPRASLDRVTAAESASQQQLTAANSEFALADSTLKRFQTLHERKSVSPQEFDEVKTRQQAAAARRDMARAEQEQAQAAVAQAKTTLEYTRIRSPFDGVVTEKKLDSGALASPGMPIFTVEDVRHYRLEAAINEGDLAFARIGQSVQVLIDALGTSEIRGKVTEIVPAADPASRSFLIKVDLPSDPRLRSGLFGRVQLSRGQRPSLLVPQTAVVERGQLQGVFVLDQNKVATLHYVTLGKPTQGNVEILAGLQDGDRLVASPGSLELDGKRIEAQ
jgi:RND family efflux transporter MFP subunit